MLSPNLSFIKIEKIKYMCNFVSFTAFYVMGKWSKCVSQLLMTCTVAFFSGKRQQLHVVLKEGKKNEKLAFSHGFISYGRAYYCCKKWQHTLTYMQCNGGNFLRLVKKPSCFSRPKLHFRMEETKNYHRKVAKNFPQSIE